MRRLNILVGVLSIPLFVAAWEAIARSGVVNIVLFPPPSIVAVAVLEWVRSGQFFSDFAASLYRVVTGFALGAVSGVVLGVLTGQFPLVSSLLSPLFHILRPIPPIAFVPIVILWFGLSEAGKLFLVFWGVFFTVWLSAHIGVQKVDRGLIRAALMLGTPRRQMLQEIVFLGALPYIVVGLRTAVSISFYTLVAAELAGAFAGIVYRIEIARTELADRPGDGWPGRARIDVVRRGSLVRDDRRTHGVVAMMQIRRRAEAEPAIAHSQPSAAGGPAEVEATIRVSDLSIVFDTPQGQVIAVDRVTFGVNAGEFVCIVGPSGCGKSTVLNTIAGLEVPYSGEVTVNGRLMQRPRPDVGMVFQQPHLFPWKSVRRNIAHGPRMLGKSRSEARAIADGLIEMIGLGRFADAYPHTLSGGMQQRVAIARALANQPRVLLMDEPFGALDAQTRSVMQDNLLELRDRIDATVVFVTHDLDEAILLADRVLIMSAGPGRILRDLGVNLPRPRSNGIMLDPAYIALKKDCLDLIRSEGRRAFERSSAG